MAKRVLAVVALCCLLAACGRAPDYTIRQAAIDMPAFEPNPQFYDGVYAKCVAQYLFDRLSPGNVKALIQGADFGYSTPTLTAAEDDCAGSG